MGKGNTDVTATSKLVGFSANGDFTLQNIDTVKRFYFNHDGVAVDGEGLTLAAGESISSRELPQYWRAAAATIQVVSDGAATPGSLTWSED